MTNTSTDDGSRPDFVTALARGLSVIEAFSAESPELTLSEVAARARIAPATARRALMTLEQLGYVGQLGKRFVLRPKVLSLGSAFLNSMNIRELAQPSLQALADQFKDSASLAVLDGNHVMYIAHVPNSRHIRYNGSVGYRSPAFATSLGLVLWASLEPHLLDTMLACAPFPAYTSKTLTTKDQLSEALSQVRTQGYATAQEQLEYNIVALAVPVRDSNGNVIAAINCSSELTRNDLPTLVATRLQPLLDTASQIERGLQRFPALAHSIMTS